MEKLFKLQENGTTVKTELLAGLTTFMTMAYIIALNPNLLTNFAVGTPLWNGVFLATCIASAIGTICMAFMANKPFVMAPGMGLNSFFAVVVANIAVINNCEYESAFQAGLVIILVEGIVFLVLTLLKVREKIVEAIPLGVRYGIAPAIGLMLMNIGLGSNVGIYAEGNGFTSPFYIMRDFFGALTPSIIKGSMGDIGYHTMVLTAITAFLGVFMMVVLAKKGIKASVLLGMLFSSAFLGVNPFASLETASFVPPFADMVSTTLFKFDFAGFVNIGWFTAITLIITFCMIDMFDTIGTLVGTASRAGMVDKDGNMPKMKEALLSDAIGTIAGAATGTSTVTTFIDVPRPHRRHHPRRCDLRRAHLRRRADAPGPQERQLRRYGSDAAGVHHAHRYARVRLHRPRHRSGPDLLHRGQGLLRQGQGRQRSDLCHLPPLPHQVLRGGVRPIQRHKKERPFGRSFLLAFYL